MKATIVRYSEAFKLQVVSELESGKYRSYKEACDSYGIKGAETIPRWLKQYGKCHLLNRIVRVETVNEKDQLKALKEEIAQLKEAVADSKVQEVIHKAAFLVVCDKYGLGKPEDVKKKLGV